MLSLGLLSFLVPATLALALAAAPYVLVLGDVMSVLLPGEWSVADVAVDVTDLLLAGVLINVALQRKWITHWLEKGMPHLGLWAASLPFITVAYLLAGSRGAIIDPLLVAGGAYASVVALCWLGRRRDSGSDQGRSIPYLGLWIVYGTLVSVAYLHAPANQDYFSSPLAVAYQLYRYSWRPILYFILVALLIGDRRRLDTVFLVVVLTASAVAVQAIWQGYTGLDVRGPFVTKNQLGGNLVAPLVLALSGLLHAPSRRSTILYALSTLLMARALTMCASRGAFVAAAVGAAALLVFVLITADGRPRALRVLAAGSVLAAFVFMLKPDFTEGPAVRQLLALGQGTGVDNFQWRLHERWPYFWQQMWTNPWFGLGSEVDLDLGLSANTPHNGYLALAVSYGMPAALTFFTLAALGAYNGLRAFRHGHDPWQRITGITITAALAGLFTHNIIDATFLLPFAGKLFWLLIATAAVLGRRPHAFPAVRIKAASRQPAAPGRLAFRGARA